MGFEDEAASLPAVAAVDGGVEAWIDLLVTVVDDGDLSALEERVRNVERARGRTTYAEQIAVRTLSRTAMREIMLALQRAAECSTVKVAGVS